MKKKKQKAPDVPLSDEQQIVGDPEGFHPPKAGEGSKRPQAADTSGADPGLRKPDRDDQQVKDKMLDKTLEDSFPTSDPPSSIPDPSEEDSFAA